MNLILKFDFNYNYHRYYSRNNCNTIIIYSIVNIYFCDHVVVIKLTYNNSLKRKYNIKIYY